MIKIETKIWLNELIPLLSNILMLKVLTYNIWFNNFIEDERLESLHTLVAKTDPHVVCLQEVRACMFDKLVKMFTDYTAYPSELDQSYDSITLIKNDNNIKVELHEFIPFEHSIMMRNLHIVKINYHGTPVVIGNTHFESIFDPLDARIKMKYRQYKQAKDIMENIFGSEGEELILCCDSNITKDDHLLFENLYGDWVDSWSVDKTHTTGYTYDTDTNVYLTRLSRTIRTRIDKIMSRGGRLSVDNVLIVNKKNCGLKHEPSDHYGVLAEFSVVHTLGD